MSANFRFNNDLLRGDLDRQNAYDAYGRIYFALDNPDLRALFEPRDDAANDAKKRSRRRGIQAVLLVMLALLIAAWAPIWEQLPALQRQVMAAIGGLLGLYGGFLGLTGVLFGETKREWLRNRFITERLRQLHFQTLLALAPIVLSAAETEETDLFLKARTAALAQFESDQIAHIDAKLGSVLSRDVGDEPWIPDIPFDSTAPEGPYLDLFLEALSHLRINHQIDFAEYKLSSDEKLFSVLPFRQIKVLDTAAFACVLILLILDVLVLIGAAAILPAPLLPWVHGWAISFAIVALAVRTLEEGLQPHREVERYRQYGSALRLIRNRFQQASNPRDKLQALKDLEDLSYWEMVSFLKSSDESRFVM